MKKTLHLIFSFFVFSVFGQSDTSKKSPLTQNSITDSLQDLIVKHQQLSVKAQRSANFETFKKHCDTILEIADENGLEILKIKALMHIGIYYKNVDQYDKAIESYLTAMEIYDSLEKINSIDFNNKGKASILVNLGNLYEDLGEYLKVQKIMQEVIQLSQSIEDSDYLLTAAYNTLGIIEYNNDNYLKSLEYFQLVNDIATKTNRKDLLIVSLNNLADNYRLLKEYDKAIANCLKVLELITPEDSIEEKARAQLILGDIYIDLNQPVKALNHLKDVYEIALQGNFLKIRMDSHKNMANAYEILGDLKNSLEQQKEYNKTRADYLKTISKAQRLELEKESETKSKLIEEQTEKLIATNKEKTLYLILSFILLILLIGARLFYKNRKDKISFQTLTLKEDKSLLENENEALKEQLRKLAQKNQIQDNTEKRSTENRYKNSTISPVDRKKYMSLILDYMESEKPYLDSKIKQSDIAENLSMSVHLFSEVLNVCFQRNFNNFINLYRVNEAKKLLKKTSYNNFKILTIAYDSGFASKTSFNRIFKKLVGITPSEYRDKYSILSAT